MYLTLLSPAKLNLFLTITGKREDGYHNLQTFFQFVEFGDRMTFTLKQQENELHFSNLPFSIKYIDDNHPSLLFNVDGSRTVMKESVYVKKQLTQLKLSHPSKNLIYRAAKALLDFTRTRYTNQPQKHLPFVEISINKLIPLEAGLGGGSSNAATTLLALNQVWKLDLSNKQLAEIGLTLGADVPIFINGHAAFAEGVGEKLIQVEPMESWYLLIYPNIGVSTASLFSSEELNRNSPVRTLDEWKNITYYNDFELIARKLYPAINDGFDWLTQFGKPRMTGTGSTLFLDFESKELAMSALQKLPNDWWAVVTKGANLSLVHKDLYY